MLHCICQGDPPQYPHESVERCFGDCTSSPAARACPVADSSQGKRNERIMKKVWACTALTAGFVCLLAFSQRGGDSASESLVQEGIFTPGVQVTLVPRAVPSARQATTQSLADVAMGTHGTGSNGMYVPIT